jgi:putative membrane protein
MVAMMLWYGGHWAWWHGGLMWIGMLVFWGLLIWAVYALITNLTRKPPGTGQSGDDARRILDQRLARGEIDTAEYQRLRDLIETGGHQSPAGTGSPR